MAWQRFEAALTLKVGFLNAPACFSFLEIEVAFCFRQNEACFGGTIVEAEGGDAETRGDLGVGENDGFEKSFGILAEGHAHQVGACFAAFGVAGLVAVAAHALGGSVGLENLEAVLGIPSGKGWSPLGERIFSGEVTFGSR